MKAAFTPLIGKPVWLRTVTQTDCGILTEVGDDYVILEQAVWVSHTGDFSKFVVTGTASAVSPLAGRVIINLSALIDAGELPQVPPAVGVVAK